MMSIQFAFKSYHVTVISQQAMYCTYSVVFGDICSKDHKNAAERGLQFTKFRVFYD